jgi:hypothetical protein
VNLLGDNIESIKDNTDNLIDATKEAGVEIKRRLNSGNACYHSVQNRLSSPLLSKNVKFRMYKTIIFPVVLYMWENLSLILRETETERLRVKKTA